MHFIQVISTKEIKTITDSSHIEQSTRNIDCHGQCTYFCWEAAQTKTLVIFLKMCCFVFFHPQAFVIQWHKKTDDTVFPDGLSKEYIRSLQYLTSYMQCCLLPMYMNSYCYQESQVLESGSNFMIVNILNLGCDYQ